MSEANQLYFGGLPTGPQVRKLEEAFPDIESLRASTIPHEEIEAAINEKRGTGRYKTVVDAWRRKVERNTGIVISGLGEAQGIGYRVLAHGEQVGFGVNKRKKASRYIRRGWAAVANTDDDRLSAQERDVKQHEMFAAGKLHALSIELRKPKPAAIEKPEAQPSAAPTKV